jgi:hypothetical protein
MTTNEAVSAALAVGLLFLPLVEAVASLNSSTSTFRIFSQKLSSFGREPTLRLQPEVIVQLLNETNGGGFDGSLNDQAWLVHCFVRELRRCSAGSSRKRL